MEQSINHYPDVRTFMTEVRQKNGHSQKDIADLLGVDHNSISRIEEGVEFPNFDLFTAFLNHFNFKLNDQMVKNYTEAERLANVNFNAINSQDKAYNESAATSQRKETQTFESGEELMKTLRETLWDAVKTLYPSEPNDKLQESLNQYMTLISHNITIISFNEFKRELLDIRTNDWSDINQSKDDLSDDDKECIIKKTVLVESEAYTFPVYINVNFNKVFFRFPKTDEEYIQPLIDIFPGPRYRDHLYKQLGYNLENGIVEIVIYNPNH